MSHCRSRSSSQLRLLPPVDLSCEINNIPTLPSIWHIFKLAFACSHRFCTSSINSVHPFQFCLTRHASHTCGHSASRIKRPDSWGQGVERLVPSSSRSASSSTIDSAALSTRTTFCICHWLSAEHPREEHAILRESKSIAEN